MILFTVLCCVSLFFTVLIFTVMILTVLGCSLLYCVDLFSNVLTFTLLCGSLLYCADFYLTAMIFIAAWSRGTEGSYFERSLLEPTLTLRESLDHAAIASEQMSK